LQFEINDRLTIVLSLQEWYIERFIYNKDIFVKYLESKYSSNANATTVIRWASKGLFKIKYLGVVFQIYCKQILERGECLRVDGYYTSSGASSDTAAVHIDNPLGKPKEKKNMVNLVGNIATVNDTIVNSYTKNKPKSIDLRQQQQHDRLTVYFFRKNLTTE